VYSPCVTTMEGSTGRCQQGDPSPLTDMLDPTTFVTLPPSYIWWGKDPSHSDALISTWAPHETLWASRPLKWFWWSMKTLFSKSYWIFRYNKHHFYNHCFYQSCYLLRVFETMTSFFCKPWFLCVFGLIKLVHGTTMFSKQPLKLSSIPSAGTK